MSDSQIDKNSDVKQDDNLNPISVRDMLEPTEDLQETSPEREMKIKSLQEKLGVSRDIAERMVDESGGSA